MDFLDPKIAGVCDTMAAFCPPNFTVFKQLKIMFFTICKICTDDHFGSLVYYDLTFDGMSFFLPRVIVFLLVVSFLYSFFISNSFFLVFLSGFQLHLLVALHTLHHS